MAHDIVWLEHAQQRLGLVPALGGGVAAWQLLREGEPLDLWRPWDGSSHDRYSLANFPLVPWSNRISGGGFEQAGHFHPMAPNRAGEPYPIHGDGWLQAWQCERAGADTMRLALESHRFDGNPYDYEATQTFVLRSDGLDQTLSVTHLGAEPLPYGLGLHPYLPRTPMTRLTAPVRGVWLSGSDPLPKAHSTQFPRSWDLSAGVSALGPMVDNGFTGWSGEARIDWPEHGLRLVMREPAVVERGQHDGYCLLYRPPHGQAFCFEPVSHPIDAFHLTRRPGLRVLAKGETLSLHIEWRVEKLTR